jgi:hypothetical protein
VKYRSYSFASLSAVLPALLGLGGCTAGGLASADTSADAAAPGDASTSDTSASTQLPGRYLTSTSTVGAGACSGVSLENVLAKIRALQPSLADIQTIYVPSNASGDGSFVYPFARADGGFDVVVKRGLGDCPAGCTENDYRYFATDAACTPVQVGHFHAGWSADNCLAIEGAPLWNHPPPPDPLTVCGQQDVPADIGGTYTLHAVGQRTPCTFASASGKVGTLDESVELVIRQDATDPATGTVTFSGTGHALVDGVPLPAHFQQRRFDAALSSNAAACGSSVTARYDFDGDPSGGIEVNEQSDSACATCSGSMTLTLTPSF